MCGIAGIMAHAGYPPVDADLLKSSSDALRERGPDSQGIWLDPAQSIGFAHRRLSIIDLSDAASQPMHHVGNRYSIIFNGEIYNYRALRAELSARGEVFRTHGDTEVILALYAREGAAMLRRLRGMYAIAIWDAETRSLFLARDPYGIKPLYYAEQASRFSFASQVRALLTDKAISRRLSLPGYAGYQLWGSIPEPHTLFDAVKSLPAGHFLRVSSSGSMAGPVEFDTLTEHYHPRAKRMDKGDIRSALLDSVQHHLEADVEVGCFLSGGIDSGALVGLMRDCGQMRIKTFTLAFGEFRGTELDEADAAAAVARQYATDHHVETISQADFSNSLPAILEAIDQPTIDGVNTWFVSRAVHRAGLKVALSGVGGDELFCGYSTFDTVPAMVRRMAALHRMPLLGPTVGKVLSGVARQALGSRPKAAHYVAHSRSISDAYILRRSVRPPAQLIDEDHQGIMVQGLEQLAAEQGLDAMIAGVTHSRQQVSILESGQYMRNQLLRDSDWASMAHSLELRTPLVDIALLDRVARYQPYFSESAGKKLLGTAPSVPLPPDVLNRKKSGFAIPVAQWIRPSGEAPAGAPLANWGAVVLDHYSKATGLELPAS